MKYALESGCKYDPYIFGDATKNGHFDILEWACNYGYKFDVEIQEYICSCLAENGNLEWLQKIRIIYNFNWCKNTCESAAKNGHFELLKWVRSKGCSWDIQTSATAFKYGLETGKFEMFDWVFEHGCEMDFQSMCIGCAIYGNLEKLQWAIIDMKCEFYSPVICAHAAKKGHLHILQWMHSRGYNMDSWVFAEAALSGHLHVIEWAYRNEYPWNARVCSLAAKGGHLEILKWLRARNCPWDNRTFMNATQQNFNSDMIKWLLENECPQE